MCGGVNEAGVGDEGGVRWLCGPRAHTLLCFFTEGAHQSWCQARHQENSSSEKMLPTAKRIVRSTMEALVASPAPMVIGSRCPAEPVEEANGARPSFRMKIGRVTKSIAGARRRTFQWNVMRYAG